MLHPLRHLSLSAEMTLCIKEKIDFQTFFHRHSFERWKKFEVLRTVTC